MNNLPPKDRDIAMVFPNREPRAFLMDEPPSNLDAKLRVSMRASLSQLHGLAIGHPDPPGA